MLHKVSHCSNQLREAVTRGVSLRLLRAKVELLATLANFKYCLCGERGAGSRGDTDDDDDGGGDVSLSWTGPAASLHILQSLRFLDAHDVDLIRSLVSLVLSFRLVVMNVNNNSNNNNLLTYSLLSSLFLLPVSFLLSFFFFFFQRKLFGSIL